MNEWEARAHAAAERKDRLLSFGTRARGLLAKTDIGLFVVDPEDNEVARRLLQNGTYADAELALVKHFVTRRSNVLVAGTHIGAHVVPLSRLCRRLYAIEANPQTFELFSANLKLNDCTNVVAYNLAASDREETIKFVLNRENSGGSKRKPDDAIVGYFYDNPDIIEVEARPLDKLLRTRWGVPAFDLILMDIEGSEYFALKGMQAILRKAGALFVEFLPHHIRDVAKVSLDDFAGTFLPHFETLYIPSARAVVPKPEILRTLRRMHNQGEGHDGLIFLKKEPPAALLTSL